MRADARLFLTSFRNKQLANENILSQNASPHPVPANNVTAITGVGQPLYRISGSAITVNPKCTHCLWYWLRITDNLCGNNSIFTFAGNDERLLKRSSKILLIFHGVSEFSIIYRWKSDCWANGTKWHTATERKHRGVSKVCSRQRQI